MQRVSYYLVTTSIASVAGFSARSTFYRLPMEKTVHWLDVRPVQHTSVPRRSPSSRHVRAVEPVSVLRVRLSNALPVSFNQLKSWEDIDSRRRELLVSRNELALVIKH
ncbi:hypothetical protein K474DRAFT_1517484 [Panus rudis PR-1116 ss-1]|nr:hypothetical protein K474DRAFT_1517484 [Panus rudis PR-1116 ss-1]